MNTARLLIGVVALAFEILSVRTTAAQVDPRMPDGPNRDLVIRRCTTRHDIGNLVSTAGRTRAAWNAE